MIRVLTDILRGISAVLKPTIRPPFTEVATQRFALLIGRCPVCGRTLHSHAYHALAMAVATSHTFARLAEAIERRDWKTAHHHEWDAEMDSFQFTVINCPNSLRLGLVETFHPFDLMSNSRLEMSEALTEQDSAALRSEIGDDWAQF